MNTTDIKRTELEIKNTKRILKFFSLFGVDKDITHIISPNDENPTIVFSVDNKMDYLRILTLLKQDTLDIYLEQLGTTGFKPILPVEVIKESDTITLCKSPYVLDTDSDSIYGYNKIKVVFYIPNGRGNYYTIWIEPYHEIFDNYLQHKEETINTFETEQARKYNPRNKPIMMNRLIFNDVLTIKFYGGHTSHYATGYRDAEQLNKIVELH